MNTMLRSSTAPTKSALAPSSLTTMPGRAPAAGGVHRGIWIGGGLMALTIVALATALVVKGGNSGSQVAAPLATVPAATTTATTSPTPDATLGTAPVNGANVAQAQTPTQAPVQSHAPVHHAAPVSTTHSSTHSGGGNTTVADAGGSTGNAAPSYSEPVRTAPPVCSTCGTVDSYNAVQVQGTTNGVGAVGGGAVGAVVGSQIAGRHNHTLGGVIGAIGGGLLGNEIEKHQRTSTVYDVRVRMDDGSIRTIRQSTVPVVGSKVTVDGNTLHGGSGSSGSYGGNGSTGGNGYQGQSSGNGSTSFTPSGT